MQKEQEKQQQNGSASHTHTHISTYREEESERVSQRNTTNETEKKLLVRNKMYKREKLMQRVSN